MVEHISVDDIEEFIYPPFYKGTSSVDYHMATYVISSNNNVTMQELPAYFSRQVQRARSVFCFSCFFPHPRFEHSNWREREREDFIPANLLI
jgi:hypothetical protein